MHLSGVRIYLLYVYSTGNFKWQKMHFQYINKYVSSVDDSLVIYCKITEVEKLEIVIYKTFCNSLSNNI